MFIAFWLLNPVHPWKYNCHCRECKRRWAPIWNQWDRRHFPLLWGLRDWFFQSFTKVYSERHKNIYKCNPKRILP